jgi:hypothetical protein
VVAIACSRALDALSLGETTAASLGVALAPVRIVLVGVMALATGAAVAQVGLIAFIGLVAPHLVRAAVKPTHAGCCRSRRWPRACCCWRRRAGALAAGAAGDAGRRADGGAWAAATCCG